MPVAPPRTSALAQLLEYPDERFAARLQRCLADLNASVPDAAPLIDRFVDEIVDLPLGALQELYADTFDLTADCTLEIGWHLYGESYERGAFLASLREALDAAGIEENGELPDYLPRLLVLLERSDAERAERLRRTIAPGIKKLERALHEKRSPYEHLLRSIAAAVQSGG